MKGFLKRDWALICVNLRFYLLFIGFALLLTSFADFSTSVVSLYLVVFAAVSVMNLFAYDEANHWEGYAAAAPNGRRAMVDARYVMSLCVSGIIVIFQAVIGRFSHEALVQALMFGGIALLYSAIVLPVFYRFGSTKSRIALIVIMAVFSASIAAAASALSDLGIRVDISLFLLPLGIVAMLISQSISHAIVRRKEF